MVRLPDWEQRLHDYLDGLSGAVFAWHDLDCARFGAGVVEALTGEDHFAPFRGRYRTAVGAARALRRHGAGTLEDTFAAVLPDRPIGFARRGDLVLVDGMIGACVGSDALFVGEEDGAPGLVRFERARWARCWGVG